MKNYIAEFWRGNPQIKGGGYKTTRDILAKSLKSATKQALEYEKNVLYGTMVLERVKEKK